MAEYQNGKPLTSYSGKVKKIDGDKVIASLKDAKETSGLERDIDLSLKDINAKAPIVPGDFIRVDVLRSIGNGRAIKENAYIVYKN